MNRAAFVIAGWLFLGLDAGLSHQVLGLGRTGIAPSFLLILTSFVAMSAPSRTASWAALALGLLGDLTADIALRPVQSLETHAFILGPRAIAFLLAAHLILSMRGVMIRRNPLTLGFLVLVGGAVAQVTLVAILWWRQLLDPIAMDPTHELLYGLGSCLYSALVAVPVALLLLPAAPLLGLPGPQQRRFGR